MDPFIAEIRIFPINYAPRGWAFCNGQNMPIAQNTTLYSLIGAIYGGDGRTNFSLPNLQGKVAIQPGQGAGLSSYQLGQTGGSQTVTLGLGQMPTHNHDLLANNNLPDDAVPSPVATLSRSSVNAYKATSGTTPFSPMAVGFSGGGGAHNNMMPFLALNFCIALAGIYPPRP